MKPVVAVVGRPNVGKSTFFNRLTRSRSAIVDDFAGVTRDRNYADVTWDDQVFTFVDTGGFVDDNKDGFTDQIRQQVEMAIEDADAVIFLLDGKKGISPFDTDMAELLRKEDKPVYFVVNKIDDARQEDKLFEFYALGVDELYPVSAEHGHGINDLMDLLAASFPAKFQPVESVERPIALSIVGRPNVGKSSLINRILGENRLVVSEIPGTTRDAVDSFFKHKGVSYILTDTAGIRRKGRVRHKLEKFSVVRALKSLERCDIALVLFDATEGVTDQDLTVAGYAMEQGRACILLINKWDLMEKDPKASRRFIEDLKVRAPFLHFAPAMTISAKTGLRVKKIFEAVNDVYKQYTLRISTGELNRILEKATTTNVPSLYHGKRLKFYYITQVASLPPTFVVFVNHPEGVHFSYRRFLVNRIREMAGLDRIPIRLYFRERSGRREYENKKTRKKKR